MKHRWRKWAALLLTVALALPLGACGKRASDDGVVRLRWVTYGGSVPADLKEIIAAANACSREKIGVVVDLELQPSDMLNLIMASGEYYDIIYTCEWLNSYDKAAAKGLYYDITDLVKAGKQQEAGVRYRAAIEKLWEIERLPVVGACTELPVAYQQTGFPPEMGISSLEALADGCIRELYKPL
jgi:putative aldouronate transport system substrate-binding protein